MPNSFQWLVIGIVIFVLYDISRVLIALYWRFHYKKHYGKNLHSKDPEVRQASDRSLLLAASSLLTQRPELGPTVHTELERAGFLVSLRVDEPLLVHDLLHILSKEKLNPAVPRYEFVILGIGENDLAIRPWSIFSVRWWARLRRCFELASELGDHIILVHGLALIPHAKAIPWFYRHFVIAPCIWVTNFFLEGELVSFPHIKLITAPKHLEIGPDGTHLLPTSHQYLAWLLLRAMKEEGQKDKCYASTIEIPG